MTEDDLFDEFDKKRIKLKKFSCIGVKPRVDSNPPLSNDQKLIEKKQKMMQDRL